MSRIEQALDRLDAALDALEGRLSRVGTSEESRDNRLQAERDALLSKVRKLEAQSEEDAQLRGEAAQAVRAALSDLRAMAAQGGMLHG